MSVVAWVMTLWMLGPVPVPQPAQPQAQALEEEALKLVADRKFEEAKKPAAQALALREAADGPQGTSLVRVLRVLGFARMQTGDLEGAATDFRRVAAILRNSPTPEDRGILAGVLTNLGQIHFRQSRWREADATLTEALSVLQKSNPSPEALAPLYNALGGFLWTTGDYERAGVQFARAAEEWSRVLPSDDARLGTVFNNLGLVAQSGGRYAEAKAFYEKALAIREKGNDTRGLGQTLTNLGSALYEEGKAAEALPLYERAIPLLEQARPAAVADHGKALNNLAVALFALKQNDRAASAYRAALEFRERMLGPHHADVAASLTAHAIFLQASGQAAAALHAQSRATDIIERNLEALLEVGSESQKERALRLFAENVDIALWMRSVSGDNAAANETALLTVLRRKGRLQEVLASSSAALRTRLQDGVAPALDELMAARAALAQEFIAGGATPAQQARIATLEARVNTLEAAIGRSGASATARAAVTVERIAAAIPADAVLIEVFRYRPFDPSVFQAEGRFKTPRYVAYALSRGRLPVWIELGDAAAIDDASVSFRSALLNPRRADVKERGIALRPLITGAFERLAGPARKVYLAPDGDLNLLPFHALVAEGGEFLLDRYDITYLTGGRDLLADASVAKVGASLVVGNPDFGRAGRAQGPISRSFARLPGADREARAVAALIPGATLLSGSRATEGAIKRVAAPAVLHIATHGFFLQASGADAIAGTRGLRQVGADDAAALPPLLRSGLAFAGANRRQAAADEDGILTASEAALLNLHGTELVFLSACESGLGVVSAGESVYGLRRAFAIAGARSQVLTLWQVNDVATQRFVEDFYRALLGGSRRDDALREAQRAARRDAQRRHPFYWAAFILSGEDDAIQGATRKGSDR